MCFIAFVEGRGDATNFGDLAKLFNTKPGKIPTTDGEKMTNPRCCLCVADLPACAKKFGYKYKVDDIGNYVFTPA